MKFKTTRQAIYPALQQVMGVIEKKQTLPILSNVLLTANEDQLTLVGTDLEVQMVATVSIEPEQSGEITAPARKLVDICRFLSDDSQLLFELKEDRLIVRSGRSRFSLLTLPADSYPQFSTKAYDFEIALDHSMLRKMLDKTIFSVAQQDSRRYLNGLLLEVNDDQLNAVGSDGHRMAIFMAQLPESVGEHRTPVIPRKGISEINRLLDDASEQPIKLKISPNSVQVVTETATFSAKLIDATYPEFKKAIPRNLSETVTIDKTVLRDALQRVAILANDIYHGITLAFEANLLLVEAVNPDHENAQEELEIDYSSAPFSISFNVAYLLEAINHIDAEQVRISFTEQRNICLIEDPSNTRVKLIVMPMKL